jgi:predicted nucleic acid binding AN1-type Zn finger protein
LIKLRSKTVIADIPFLMSVMENLDKMSTMQLANKLTTVINESSHVWTTESAISHFVGKDESIKEKVRICHKNFIFNIQLFCI